MDDCGLKHKHKIFELKSNLLNFEKFKCVVVKLRYGHRCRVEYDPIF